MKNFYLNQINFNALMLFNRFIEQIEASGEKEINIYVEETGNGILVAGMEFYRRLKELQSKNYHFYIYASQISEQGIALLMAVPLENRYIADIGKIQWNVFRKDEEKQEPLINSEENSSQFFAPEFYQYTQVVELITKHSKLDYEDLEKLDHKIIDATQAIHFGLASKSFRILNEKNEAMAFINHFLQTGELLYIFPPDVQEKLDKALKNYKEGIISHKERTIFLIDALYRFVEERDEYY